MALSIREIPGITFNAAAFSTEIFVYFACPVRIFDIFAWIGNTQIFDAHIIKRQPQVSVDAAADIALCLIVIADSVAVRFVDTYIFSAVPRAFAAVHIPEIRLVAAAVESFDIVIIALFVAV